MSDIDLTQLAHNTSIISTAEVQLNYYTYLHGVPVLSATLKNQAGTVYFVTNDLLVDHFYSSLISLQALYDKSKPITVTIVLNDEVKQYEAKEIKIKIEQGRKLFAQLRKPGDQ